MRLRNKLLEDLYRTMIRIRLCEESFVDPILDGTIKCPVHLYSGQEAIATGICANLKEGDYIFGNHRSHGHYLAKGGNLNEMVAEIYCRKTGCAGGRGGSMHLISPENGVMGVAPIVAGTISLAVGAALAAKTRGDGRIAVSFFGDGATGEGTLYESINFAALYKLPVIFVCENNFYSTHMHIRKIRIDEDISKLGGVFGIPSYRADGNDVLETFRIGRKAAEWVRLGNGPVFIEFLTYRLRGHVGPDDNIQGTHMDIRPQKEIENWKKKDPIPRFEEYLLKEKVLDAKKIHAIKKTIINEVSNAHRFARESARPPGDEVGRYVYTN